MLIEWKPSLSVGVREMDNQHQKLVSLINELHDAMATGKGRDALGRLLTGLVQYTAGHFRSEEQYMQSIGYPGLEKHRKEHQDLTARVVDFKAQFDTGKTMLTVQLMNFLKYWLQDHIIGMDREYGPAGVAAAGSR